MYFFVAYALEVKNVTHQKVTRKRLLKKPKHVALKKNQTKSEPSIQNNQSIVNISFYDVNVTVPDTTESDRRPATSFSYGINKRFRDKSKTRHITGKHYVKKDFYLEFH